MKRVKFGSLKNGDQFINSKHHMLRDKVWTKRKPYRVEFGKTDRPANCDVDIWFDNLSDNTEVTKV